MNVRDLGGLTTRDGRHISRGALIRSDQLCRLDAGGRDALLAHGVRTVIDLRTPAEAEKDPDPLLHEHGVDHVLVPQQDGQLWQDPDWIARTRAERDAMALDRRAEHIAAMARAVANAAPGGVLIVAVPDAGGLQARVFGRCWFHLDVPRHLFHFDMPSIRLLLDTTGFQVVDAWHHELEYDLFGWIQSALNGILKTPNVLFDFLTRRPRRTGHLPILFSLLFATVTFPVAFALTVVSTLARKGGTLIVAARVYE